MPLNPGDLKWGDRDRTREILLLKQTIAEMQKKIAALEAAGSTPGNRGPAGPQGARGPAGTITVVLLGPNGQELKRAAGVMSGSTVRIPIRRRIFNMGEK